jgi:hypothetical protein
MSRVPYRRGDPIYAPTTTQRVEKIRTYSASGLT